MRAGLQTYPRGGAANTLLVNRCKVTDLIGSRRCLRLEGLVPPPLGPFAGGTGTRRDSGWGFRRWSGQRCGAQRVAGVVGDGDGRGGTGDGDDAAVVQPVVIRAQQYQIG